jgi:hypothetical protein
MVKNSFLFLILLGGLVDVLSFRLSLHTHQISMSQRNSPDRALHLHNRRNIIQRHVASKHAENEYDLFGRVPNDDWLFSTARLTDPNLLKQSIPEMVNS